MSDALDLVYRSVDEQHADLPAATRRRFVTGAAAAIGSMGLLGTIAKTAKASTSQNSTETILAVAATAEVLATIVNTVGWERGLGRDAVTQRNIKAAAREELVHYNVLTSIGGEARDQGSGCRTRCSQAAPTCSTRCRSATRSSSTPT